MVRGRKPRSKSRQEIVARRTPAAWEVKWHPKAQHEKQAIDEATERVAIAHVIEKLQVDGPALRSPHQSAVLGEEGSGLRELRPRRGRSRWRPIYRRMDESLFAILSIGPEAKIDRAGYERAVRTAKRRLERLENGKGKEYSTPQLQACYYPKDGMMACQLISNEDVLADQLRDTEFREEWERTALARWLAVEVVHYRAERHLSQRQLAERLGVHQSDIARLETGEHTPTLERLIRVSKGLDIELMIDIRPQTKAAKLPKKRALEAGSFTSGGCEIVLAAA
jgi:DNA-binding XRE family transcriptional regulator